MRIPSNGSRVSASRGLTLLELVVVIFIAVVIFALAGGAMIRTMRVSRMEVNQMGRVMTARLVMEQLVRDIESAFPYRSPETGALLFRGVDAQLEHGAADQLTLVRPKLGAPVPTELERVTYDVRLREDERGSQQIVLSSREPLGRLTAVREDVLGLMEPTSNVLLNLEYLSSGPEGPVWSAAWESNAALPEAVRVRLEVTDTQVPGGVELETVVYLHSEHIGEATG